MATIRKINGLVSQGKGEAPDHEPGASDLLIPNSTT